MTAPRTATIGASEFDFVSDLVRREAAIVLERGKEYLVEARLAPLARAAGTGSVTDYVRALRQSGDHRQRWAIVEALTTNETSWFRDPGVFEGLRTELLPRLQSVRSLHHQLRFWSAAASTGQEVYSLAMVLADSLEPGRRHQILATDISNEVLERAKTGRYSQLEMNRGLPATALVKHFQREGAAWRVNDRLAAMTTFRQHNLVRPWPMMGQFDVVLLRNVLIYFDLPTKRQVLASVRRVLAPGGYLYLGASETTMGVDDAWERAPIGRTSVYRLTQDVRRDIP